VTGGTGFIGSHWVKVSLGQGSDKSAALVFGLFLTATRRKRIKRASVSLPTWVPRGQTSVLQYHLEDVIGHCGGYVLESLLSTVPGQHSQSAGGRIPHPSAAAHSRQAVSGLGWTAQPSWPPGLGLCAPAARTHRAGVPACLRTGPESGGEPVVALEAARVAQLLPQEL